MKTSKRLLSLFLAVVMALTACSAGFAAFAQEVNPKDNTPFNANNASKEGSVNALNELVNNFLPDILNLIPEETLAGAGISVEDVKNASFDDASIKSDRFYELIKEISPMLYTVLPEIGGGEKVESTRAAVLTAEGIKSEPRDVALYQYLDDADAPIDFWTMYATCLNNAKNGGNGFQQLCYDYLNGTKEKMGLREMLKCAKEGIDSNKSEFGSTLMKGFVADFPGFVTSLGLTFEGVNSVDDINKAIEKYNADNPDDKIITTEYDKTQTYQNYYKYIEYFVRCAGLDVEIKTLPTALFYFTYFYGTGKTPKSNKQSVIMAGIYNQLAIEGGADFSSLGTSDGKLSFANWFDEMKSIPGNAGKTKSQLAEAYLTLFDKTADLNLDTDSAYFAAIEAGVMAKYDVTSLKAFNNAYTIFSGMLPIAQANAYQNLLTDYAFEADNYPFEQSEYMIEIVNDKINSLVGILENVDGTLKDLVGIDLNLNPTIETFFDILFRSEGPNKEKITAKSLAAMLQDVYVNLANDPVSTIANLMPILVILLDEVVLPLLFNQAEDSTSEISTSGNPQLISLEMLIPLVAGLIGGDIQDTINSVGFHKYSIDLNKSLPELLNYINNTSGYKFEYYDELMTTDGTRKVPAIFNIEMLDKLVADNLYNYAFVDAIGASIEDKGLVDILAGLIKDVVNTLIEAVDIYLNGNDALGVKAHRNDATICANRTATVGRGLNNVTVALPTLIDIAGKLILRDLGVDSDWTYANRISYHEDTIEVILGKDDAGQLIREPRTYTVVANESLEKLKGFAFDEKHDASNVTGWIVEFVVSDVLNAIFDIANDITSTNNEITSRIPLITGLLNSLGGFTELSAVTDIFNGFFSITRDSQYSFTFGEREIPCSQDGTTYVGLSEDCAYFLIANVGSLINIVINIVNASKETQQTEEIAQMLAPYAETSAPATRAAGRIDIANPDLAEIITKQNVEAAQQLIDTVDDLLSTLLENTYIDGFKADQLDGILSAVVTFVSNFLGKSATDNLLALVQKYIGIINAENTDETGTWSGTADGAVDVKKVFSEKNLSTFVTETYVLIEDIVNALVVINGDDYGVIANAIKGVVSPGAVVSHSEYLNKELLSFTSWNDINNSKYAKDLGFSFDAGDKDAFYANLYDSLGIVASIFGGLLCTNNAQGESLYNNVLLPIFNEINAKCGAPLLTEASNGRDVLIALTASLSSVVNSLLDAPATTLMNVLAGLMGALSDDVINPAATALLNTVLGELNGLIGNNSALSVISPALKDYVMAMLEQLVPGLGGTLNTIFGFNLGAFFEPGTENAFVGFVNTLLILLPGMLNIQLPVKLGIPEFDFVDLKNSTPAEFLLKLFAIAGETVLNNEYVLVAIMGDATYQQLKGLLSEFSAGAILGAVRGLLSLTNSYTEAYWTFDHYIGQAKSSFAYPTGITASDADKAIDSLDQLVANVFPLLQQFNVVQQGSLTELLNGLAFTNANLTALAKALYSVQLDETLSTILGAFGIFLEGPQDLAMFLNQDGHKNTFKDAAKALENAQTWDDVKELNWGFKDGSAKAAEGFVNAMTAILRPFEPIVALLLGGGYYDVTGILAELTKLELNVPDDGTGFAVTLKDGVLTLTVNLAPVEGTSETTTNIITIDLLNTIKSMNQIAIYGSNAYESAIIPLLEAFMCEDVKTFEKYCEEGFDDYDNFLLNILNPVLGFVNKLAVAPIDVLTATLPNLAYFIDNNGIGQFLENLLAPITKTVIPALAQSGLDIDKVVLSLLKSGIIPGLDATKVTDNLGSTIAALIGADVDFNLSLANLSACNIQDAIVPLLNGLLPGLVGANLVIPSFDWATIASHGVQKTVKSAAMNSDGDFSTIQIVANQGETLVAVLRYIETLLVNNTSVIEGLLGGLLKDADATIKNIVSSVFNTIKVSKKDDIVKAVFYLLTQQRQNRFFDYTGFQFKEYEFEYPTTIDMEFLNVLAPMIDGILTGVLNQFMPGGLGGLVSDNLYKDSIVSSLVTGVYGAVEGVIIDENSKLNLTQLLAMTDIDFSTENVAALLTNKDYGQQFDAAARVIKEAGSWKNVKADKLAWGVKDRDSFVHALTAALRPIFGVLDVLLNDGNLGLFNLVFLPGSDGYTSAIVPLMEAFGLYNIKTQYQYREDISKEYDAILLDILNPLLDKVEDILNAPIQMLADILPNLALFFANDGLLQLIDNLLVPITALLKALEPIVNVNNILPAVGLDVKAELGKLGIKIEKFDLYDLKGTLEPVIGSANILGVVNALLKNFNLGVELMPIDWFQLASHGTVVTDEPSQAATHGGRIYVVSNRNEVLIAVLRYLINTINYKDNLTVIADLVKSLMGEGADPAIADVVGQVLGMLNGETDEVLSSLCELLQTFA